MPKAPHLKFPREGKPRADRGADHFPDSPPRSARVYLGDLMITLAYLCIAIGVILIILGSLGITAGVTPYGTHGGVTLLVIGIILYVVLLLLPAVPA